MKINDNLKVKINDENKIESSISNCYLEYILHNENIQCELITDDIIDASIVSNKMDSSLLIGQSDFDIYKGDTIVSPKAFENQILNTKSKLLKEDITVLKVPYYEVSNNNGNTVYIASEVI